MEKSLYHITSRDKVDRAVQSGVYIPASFEVDNFIHCSYRDQIADVAYRFYAGAPELVILEINPQKLNCQVVDENLEGGMMLFPHIYGVLPVDAIVQIHEFCYKTEGQWVLPAGF